MWREEGVRSSVAWREGEWGPASDSCARAAEMGVGRVVSGAMWKQGSGRRAWATRECVGRPREGNELVQF
jgi:hypothetical protein